MTPEAMAGLALAAGSAFAAAYVLLGRGAQGRRRGRRRMRTAVMAEDGPLEDILARLDALGLFKDLQTGARIDRRRSECLAQLPEMLDIVTLGLAAGLSFDASIELYCARKQGGLADAMREALLSWRMGAKRRDVALHDLADEMGVPAFRRFAAAVTQALVFGAPLSQTLERQADAIREEQRSQVSEEIEKVPVKMLIPLGTLIVPAMLLAILGPLLGSALVSK